MERTPAGQPISLTDSDYPHDDRYPGLEVALEHALQATLGPGDAIYIPSLWWHEIKSRAPLNGLVNYWWRLTQLLWLTIHSTPTPHLRAALTTQGRT